MTATCRTCTTELPLEAFHRSTDARNGRVNRCKSCVKTYWRTMYQKRKAENAAPLAVRMCNRCGIEKAGAEFSPHRGNPGGLQVWCKACRRESNRTWNLRHCYGITLEEKRRMLEAQGNACAICRRELIEAGEKTAATKAIHVDHDHKTRAVRGVLCQWCNHGIGQFHDDPDLLRAAAEYLDKYRK